VILESLFQIVLEKQSCQIPCQPKKGVQCCHVIVLGEEELSVRQIICPINSLRCARLSSIRQVIKINTVRKMIKNLLVTTVSFVQWTSKPWAAK
jgi:hypothetical protein